MRETTENKNRVIAFFRLKKRLSKQRNWLFTFFRLKKRLSELRGLDSKQSNKKKLGLQLRGLDSKRILGARSENNKQHKIRGLDPNTHRHVQNGTWKLGTQYRRGEESKLTVEFQNGARPDEEQKKTPAL
jgi:hypothetical protein